MNKFLPTIIIISLIMISAIGHAQTDTLNTTPTLYQVEIIVFEHVTSSAEKQFWPSQVTEPDVSDAIELSPPLSINTTDNTTLPSPTYQLLPERKFKLKREENKLQSQSNYKVLLHIAWIQPIGDAEDTRPIQITGSKDNSTINGTITLSMDKYIDINTVLNLNDNTLGETQTFQLKQIRRTRVNELNYLDNPLFGMLIKITPI